MTVFDIQSERLADPRAGQQQQTAQGIRPRIHTTRFVQKKPRLLAGEVRAVRMTVHFRSAHMLARIAVDVSLLAEVAVEAAYDTQILVHRVFRRWPHAVAIGGEHLDMSALRPQHVDAIIRTPAEPSRYDAPIPRPCTRRQAGEKTGDHVAHRLHMRTVSLQTKGLSAGPLTNGGIHWRRRSE